MERLGGNKMVETLGRLGGNKLDETLGRVGKEG